MWLVRADAWPCARAAPAAPAPSATGRPLAALGAVRRHAADQGDAADHPEAALWDRHLAAHGGLLDGAFGTGAHRATPPAREEAIGLASAVLDAGLARAFAAALRERIARGASATADGLLHALLAERDARCVRLQALDVHADPRLRVLEVVTSLQSGGAERVALDLAAALGEHGRGGLASARFRARLALLGSPTRPAHPAPAGTLDLAALSEGRPARLARLCDEAVRWGADVVHAHLLEREEMAAISARGLPLAATIHNARPGWPAGTDALAAGECDLLVGCARAVEADLRAAALPVPARTVWNGIDLAPFRPDDETTLRAAWQARVERGVPPDEALVLVVANPRPQKRLHLLPAILAALRERMRGRAWPHHRTAMLGPAPRDARVAIAGAPGSFGPSAAAAAEELARMRSEARRLGVEERILELGSLADVSAHLAAADCVLSTSAWEGLPLAHLEALAAGAVLVATDAGGAREAVLATRDARLVPLDATPEAFAEAILAMLDHRRARDEARHERANGRPDAERALEASPLPPGPALAGRDFSLARMAEGYARLLPRAVARRRRRTSGREPAGLLLVTNNLSTGGAQSSARRLLLGLRARGVPVAAAVLEEQRGWPTPGRRALEEAGIDVVCAPRAQESGAARVVEALLERIDAAPPRAVLLWNALAEVRVLLADALLETPLFDVSPGAMSFASLERYFARPRPGLPYRASRDYGARLAGAIVKWQGEAERAREALGAPVHVVPNGVPLEGPSALDRPARRDGAPLVIGAAARLAPQKRLEELLAALERAAPRLPPFEVRVLGGPETGSEAYAQDLRRAAEAARLPLSWAGEALDARPFLAGLDVFAMISEPPGCPNASLEAMAAGLPVVATDAGGAREQVLDGETGRIVPPADAEALAGALVEVCRDGGLRERMARAGRARAEACYSVARMVDDYARICLPPLLRSP